MEIGHGGRDVQKHGGKDASCHMWFLLPGQPRRCQDRGGGRMRALNQTKNNKATATALRRMRQAAERRVKTTAIPPYMRMKPGSSSKRCIWQW